MFEKLKKHGDSCRGELTSTHTQMVDMSKSYIYIEKGTNVKVFWSCDPNKLIIDINIVPGITISCTVERWMVTEVAE